MKSLECDRRSFRGSFVLALALSLLVPVSVRIVSASVTPTQFRSSTRDVQKIIVILVEFPDLKHSVDRSTIQERLTELDVFFREVSYGLAWIKADVTERWYEMPIPLSKYDIQKWAFNQADMSDFRRKAITVADPDVNYQNYAYVIIVAAGKVWGNAAGSQSIVNNDSVGRLNIVVLNEQSQVGTYAHELGHLAPSEYRPRGGIGLPDLYSYEASEKDQPASVFVGPWCIMDVSKTPRHFCAWGKIMLGWITPEVVKPSVTQVSFFTIQPLEKDSGVRAVEVFLKSDRYYVIEVRMGKGYDRNLPGEGVLIYYVDESKRSGYGVVRVIDRNSLTKTLDDAVFRVGDKFEDDENSVYVVVAFEENFAFTVAISGSKILSLKDTDADGLMDYVEERLATDPRNPDTDGDGLLDGEEVNKYGTNPLKRDTDADGLSDGDEVKKYGTNPLKWDTDGDGLSDGDEVNKYHTDALNPDTDRDGLTDGEEVLEYGTDSLKPDTDGDGLADGDEVRKYGTDPLKWDTDGDLWNDGIDIAPKNPLMPNLPLAVVAAIVMLLIVMLRKRRSMRALHAPTAPAELASILPRTVEMRMPSTKYCPECGFGLLLEAGFCSKCGAKQSYYGKER